MIMSKKIIYLSVGDDGGGPFSFTREIIKGLFVEARKYDLDFEVYVEGWKGDENEDRFSTLSSIPCLHFIERNPLLLLKRDKDTELPNCNKTKTEVLKNFQKNFEQYKRSISKIKEADLIIGVIDPCIIAVAKEIYPEKPALCITDHTWDVTYEKTLEDMVYEEGIKDVIDEIASMYKQADRVYMWPEPVTPREFREEAEKKGCEVKCLAGMLGSPEKTREEVLEIMKLKDLQLKDSLDIVGFLGGRRGAVYTIFRDLFDKYKENPPQGYHIVIDAKIGDVERPVFQSGNKDPKFMSERLPAIEQGLVYAFAVVKPGGGTMNGLCAARTPCIAVTERGQPQLNAIAESSLINMYGKVIEYGEFQKDPVSIIEREVENFKKEGKQFRNNLERIEQNAERSLWAEIIKDYLLR